MYSYCENVLFKAYCICLYDASLWKRYNRSALNKMRSCYNRCIKLFFGFKRRDSLTIILINLGLPSFDTVLANATASFMRLWTSCSIYNNLIFRCCFSSLSLRSTLVVFF